MHNYRFHPKKIKLAWSPLIPVQSLRISNVARTREIEWNEQLDFPSGENNLVSPQTSPTESLLLLSSSPLEADVYSRENIFLAGKRERETAVWPSLAAATFYRLITPSPPPPPLCSSSLDFATPSLCRFPRRGRETRRGGAACKNPRVARENTCAVWPSLGCRLSRPLLYFKLSMDLPPSEMEDSRENCSIQSLREWFWWMRDNQRFPTDVLSRGGRGEEVGKGFAAPKQLEGRIFNSLFLSLSSLLIRVDRYGSRVKSRDFYHFSLFTWSRGRRIGV